MVLVRPLSVRWTVTFAPATTAFDGSVTTPFRVAPPISDCANRHPPWSRTVMITIETTIFFITGIVSFLLLEHRAQRDLSAPSIGAIRAGRRRTAGPIGRDVAERRTTQAVFVRTAARVVLPVKYVESFKSEITGNALCEGNLVCLQIPSDSLRLIRHHYRSTGYGGSRSVQHHAGNTSQASA